MGYGIPQKTLKLNIRIKDRISLEECWKVGTTLLAIKASIVIYAFENVYYKFTATVLDLLVHTQFSAKRN